MPVPRILIVGKNGLLTWQDSLHAAFAELGLESHVFSVRPNLLLRQIERACGDGRQRLNGFLTNRFRVAAARFRPDLILSLVSPLFPRNVLQDLRDRQGRPPQLAAWLCDCPLPEFDAQRHVQLDAFFAFDSALHAPATAFVRKPCQVVTLPLAFDPRNYHPLPCVNTDRSVLFAGSYSTDRRQFVDGLQRQGVPIKMLGNNWPRSFFSLRQHRLSHALLNRHFNANAVVLNHLQQPNTVHGLNLRTFEATGAGAFLLTPDVPDLAACFDPGNEVATYRSPEELAELAMRGLKDSGWVRRIADAGHRRALSEHTFVHRARTVARHFGWL